MDGIINRMGQGFILVLRMVFLTKNFSTDISYFRSTFIKLADICMQES